MTSELPGELKEKGVILCTLETAVRDHPELIDRFFMKQEEALGNRKFAHLHRAFVQTGIVVSVPANVELKQPIIVDYLLAGQHASTFPHTLVVAGENSSVTVVDVFRSKGPAPGFACGVNDLYAEQGAKLNYLCIQDWNEQTLSFQIGTTQAEKDAHSKACYLNFGGSFSRLETICRSIGPGARSDLLGLSLVHGRQEFDQRTLQVHEAPHTWSDLLFKNTLNHRGKSIFSGLIKVAPGAKQTDAYQTNRNLLLDPNAEADSMPGLEINNDDVKCSHGATTSQIEDTYLFYLKARGIPEMVAKHLIAIGFCQEIIERFDSSVFQEPLSKLIEDKFSKSEKLELSDFKSAEKAEVGSDVRQLQGTV